MARKMFKLVAMEVDEITDEIALRYEGEKWGSRDWHIEKFVIPRDERIEEYLICLSHESAIKEAVVNGVPQRRGNAVYFIGGS